MLDRHRREAVEAGLIDAMVTVYSEGNIDIVSRAGGSELFHNVIIVCLYTWIPSKASARRIVELGGVRCVIDRVPITFPYYLQSHFMKHFC